MVLPPSISASVSNICYNPAMDKQKTILYVTVFFTGAAVLIFEVTAVRMLSPYFGSSLYVLSSVLTVVLAALSLGYYFGGRIADKLPHYGPLYLIISGAGLVMIFLLNVAHFILPASPHLFSILTGPLVMSFGLFFVPALLLGADSPYVIKLLTRNATPEHNGAIVGSTFFWSTVGSIVGSLSAGFFLIPTLGLTVTIVMVSNFLVLWSVIAALLLRQSSSEKSPQAAIDNQLVKLFFIVIASLFFTLTILRSDPPHGIAKVLYQDDGLYSRLQVIEMPIASSTYRLLKQDNNYSSAFLPGSQRLVFGYSQIANVYKKMYPEAKNYLVLGGGAYSIPRSMHLDNPSLDIQVWDIEPSLQKIAFEYFELPATEKIKTSVGDARVLLRNSPGQFDVIFSDVMNSGFFIPPHLSSQEFFMELKQKLSPQGVVFVNFIGSLPIEPYSLTGSMIKTITSVFPNYEIVAISGIQKTTMQNMVFVLRHEDQPIIFPEIEINDLGLSVSPIAELILDKTTLSLAEQVIFTDDLSKVEPYIFKQFANAAK